MEKELAKLNIFNSIFENIKDKGFNGLQFPLTLVPLKDSEVIKLFKQTNSDFMYFNESIPLKYSLELANINNGFTIEQQKEWFKNYIKKPNKYVASKLKQYLAKLEMNSRLRNRLDEEFLTCVQESVKQETKKFKVGGTTKFNQSFSNNEFQDLIFITCAETIYNPELEDDLSNNFAIANNIFWKRFNQLYIEVFKKKYGESVIIDDYFKQIKEDREKYGFEILEYGLKKEIYPRYPYKYMPYLKVIDKEYKNKKNEEEYISFRKTEFSLYQELCNKYCITLKRSKVL